MLIGGALIMQKSRVFNIGLFHDRNDVQHKILLRDLPYIIKNSDLDSLCSNVKKQQNFRLDNKLTSRSFILLLQIV